MSGPEPTSGYDAIAEDYAERFAAELEHKPIDRALLDLLVDDVGRGNVAGDIGCGPGHIAAHLQQRGLRMVGVDLSRRMIELARTTYAGPEFIAASMLQMPVADHSWNGAVAMYSIIHLDAAQRPRAFAEFRRVLADGAPLLVSFHVGDEVRHVDELYGHRVALDFHFMQPADVEEDMRGAGFDIEMTMRRAPYTAIEVATQRGYVLGRTSVAAPV